MKPELVFGVIAAYFFILILISIFTSKKSDNQSFFNANKNAPWYVIAFGMIGATLSGVTFISVPGEVGVLINGTNELRAFSYFQLVLGYLLGYFVIANILMPLYYKLNLISIYSYLEQRFGIKTYKTGSLFFLFSQTMGASLRMLLVAGVLQLAFFDAYEIPFSVTVLVTISLIWLYTFKGGIKTIVWTDTLQTSFMILSVIVSIYLISDELNLTWSSAISVIKESPYSKTWFWDLDSSKYFFKQFFAGTFIAIVMTGLDQNMMQKNLACRNLKEAKKNMYWFSMILLPVNLLFLALGALLYIYATKTGIPIPAKGDDLFPLIAIGHFSVFAGIVFLLGITAAAFSSADSSLTALTTAFCIDFLNFNDRTEDNQKKTRRKVHIAFSAIMYLVIIVFGYLNNDSLIATVFQVASYTYGPLLGLYAFGLFTKFRVKDNWVPYLALLSPLLSYLLNLYSKQLLFGYVFGFELLILNGAIMFTGLFLARKTDINN